MEQTSISDISSRIAALKCGVIIPTYNNDKTLKRVIDGVLEYTNNIIIVNDGCTDSTPEILKNYPQITQIHFKTNKGKGVGLREGFKKGLELDYDFAITIDSDGQHYPDDIPVFINEIEKCGNCLLIGSRNMTQESVPKGSSFGNKFSNFWYWAETGVKLTDTQSGYRLYPLKIMDKINFKTTKFEFEIENIVKASWNGVTVKNVPVKVLYDPQERVTHFRPYKDFARITVLNTWLVIVALLYIKPRDLYRRIKKKGLKRFFTEDLLKSHDSPEKKASAIALGLFFGISPFWGFHGILALSFAHFFKLNKAIAFTFSNISIPPLIPFVVYGGIKTGSWLLGTNVIFDFQHLKENIKLLANIKEYLLGSIILSFIMAILVGSLSYIFFKLKTRVK
jgi:glycosyltransferase involved in cell wall biosynthesis